jgi:hypothetical protein
MKMRRGVEVYVHTFLTSALDCGERPGPPPPNRFIPREEPPVPTEYEARSVVFDPRPPESFFVARKFDFNYFFLNFQITVMKILKLYSLYMRPASLLTIKIWPKVGPLG